MKKLAIITVVYKNYEVMNDFLKSLEKQSNKNFHLFIADLSPDKQTVSTTTPHTIISCENRGYAHGINEGVKAATDKGFELYVAMNNDTFVKDNFIEKCLHRAEESPGAVVGGKIYYAKGFEFHTDRYKNSELGKVLWYAGGIHDWKNVFTNHRGVDEVDRGQYDKLEETEFVTGCFMLFDKTVVEKVGLWDESYFLYYEDADFCERAQQASVPLLYDPEIIVWHKNAQSTDGSGSSIHQKYQTKNRVKFGMKYAPWRTKLHLLKNLLTQ